MADKRDVVVLSAVRSAIGSFGGALSSIEPRLSISHFSWIWRQAMGLRLGAAGARSVLMDTIRESDCVSVG
jgi:hypothetical protein